MRFFIFGIFLAVNIIYGADIGTEILRNGTFKNDSSWGLLQNGDASFTRLFENNMLSVSITNPGSDSWYIQLTQNKLNIKKNRVYVLSFEIKSSQPRTILTSVCKDGGDYIPYSIRDTVKVDTVFSRYSQEFQMTQPSDSIARVEFNFGYFKGDIFLKNVSLIEYAEPKIAFTTITPQNEAISGEPVKVSWTSAGLRDTLKFSVSYDNGYSWSVIQSNLKAVDSLEWIPGTIHSPWCLFKLSTSKISAISTTPLQIIPKTDLINNGSFRNSYTDWVLTADTPGCKSTMSVQNSVLTLSNTYSEQGKEEITLSQSSIKLAKDDRYELFFTCNSKPSCHLIIRLSDCEQVPDAGEKSVSIDSTPKRYSIQFKATKTVTNGELQFILTDSAEELSFSKISLINVTPPARILSYAGSRSHTTSSGQFRPVFLSGKAQSHILFSGTAEYFNLSGRKISGKQLNQTSRCFRGSGIVIVVPRNNDRTLKIDNK